MAKAVRAALPLSVSVPPSAPRRQAAAKRSREQAERRLPDACEEVRLIVGRAGDRWSVDDVWLTEGLDADTAARILRALVLREANGVEVRGRA